MNIESSSTGYFVLVLLGIIIWEYSRMNPSRIAPFGELIRHLMQKRMNRIALIAIWWWLGWHFIGSPTFP
jgi:hypothetical protein